MKIELNKYFKNDESVLYCGETVYAKLKGRVIEPIDGYVRSWTIRVQRRGTNHHYYVHVNNGRATFIKSNRLATKFYNYKEADELAVSIMETGNVINLEIVELVEFDYVEHD